MEENRKKIASDGGLFQHPGERLRAGQTGLDVSAPWTETQSKNTDSLFIHSEGDFV